MIKIKHTAKMLKAEHTNARAEALQVLQLEASFNQQLERASMGLMKQRDVYPIMGPQYSAETEALKPSHPIHVRITLSVYHRTAARTPSCGPHQIICFLWSSSGII
jgi:hypothetical protein